MVGTSNQSVPEIPIDLAFSMPGHTRTHVVVLCRIQCPVGYVIDHLSMSV